MRIPRDDMFMQIAHIVSKRGTCPRAKVGAVLVDRFHKIRSMGYNGSLPNQPHCEDEGCIIEGGHCIRSIHAERNAIQSAIFMSGPHEIHEHGYTLYVTHKPCDLCETFIRRDSKISRVVYDIPYRYDGPDVYGGGGIAFERYQRSELSDVRTEQEL